MIKIFSLIAVLGLASAGTQAATVNAINCSSTEVQNAVYAAASGDTVMLPAGCSVTWNGGVSIPGTKGITLNGNGAEVARGGLANKSPLVSVSPNASVTTRVTGFAFSDSKSSDGYFIRIGGGNETSAKFRVDHCSFTANSMGSHISITSPIYGVIDHNAFTWTGNAEVIHNEAYGANSTAGWSNVVVPGSADAVYIEDNTFVNKVSGNPAYFWGASAVQSYYGARTVFRYNYCEMCQVDQHGTAGMVGARWWEIYENTFDTVPYGNQDKYLALRGGSGVVFNNHKTGSTNLGAGSILLYEEDSGYPAPYQIGRGKNQALDPAYVWGNSSSMRVGSGSSNVQVNRDYYMSPKPGYTPYTYPHPLVAGTSGAEPPTSIPAPANLRVM